MFTFIDLLIICFFLNLHRNAVTLFGQILELALTMVFMFVYVAFISHNYFERSHLVIFYVVGTPFQSLILLVASPEMRRHLELGEKVKPVKNVLTLLLQKLKRT